MGRMKHPRPSALENCAFSVWGISDHAAQSGDTQAGFPSLEIGGAPNSCDIIALISAIGSSDFSLHLIRFLHNAFGANHCSIFSYDDERPILLAAASLDGSDTARIQIQAYLDQQCWKDDPMVAHVMSTRPVEPQLMRVCVPDLPQSRLRDMTLDQTECREWVAIFGGLTGTTVALNMHRPVAAGKFSQVDLLRLRDQTGILLTVIAKHAQILLRTGNMHSALNSLSDIILCLDLAPHPLSAREKEVCARMIYGMCSAGIAADLAISEQTVLTYRKRAYNRLGISGQHELIVWFAAQWQALHPGDDEALRTVLRRQKPRVKRRPAPNKTVAYPASDASMALGILHDAAQAYE